MLQFIRSKISSIFIKALFAILIVSFAIWGIGDIFLGSPSGRAAIAVGDVTYNSVEVLNEFDRTRRRMRLPPQAEESLQAEILDNVIDAMVESALISAIGTELGLYISEQQLKDWVAESPTFRDGTGRFDPERFRQALFNARLSEAGFFELLRQDLKRQQLVSAVRTSTKPSDALVDMIFAYRGERRTVKLLTIRFDSIDSPPKISDSELLTHYEANKDDYMAPEYRRVSLVALTPEELAKEIFVPEDELRADYHARIDEFTTPETRDFVQFLFDDEGAANAAIDQLAGPLDIAGLDKALTKAVGDGSRVELGVITRSELIDANESDAAFGTAVGRTSRPIETPFGWKIFLVRAETPEAVQDFADVREDIRSGIAHEKALDALFELANTFEDALASGANIHEAAREINVPVRRIDALDSRGRDRDDKMVERLPGGQFLTTVFETDEGERSDLLESDDGGYFLVRTDAIAKTALRPMDDVRDRVRADWIANYRFEKAMEQANALAEASKSRTGLEAAASRDGLSVTTAGPFDRTGNGLNRNIYPPDLPSIVFDLTRGDVGITESDTGASVAELIEIVPVNAEKQADLRDEIANELSSSIGADYLESFLTALRKDHDVTIDRGYIDTLMAENR